MAVEHAPRAVSRGAKLHGDAVEVSIDWLRLRGHKGRNHEVMQVLSKFFGDSEPGRGRYYYGKAERFEAGAVLLWDEERDDSLIDLAGSVLGTLEAWEVIELVRILFRHGYSHATRVDVAIDFRGKDLRLVQSVMQACENGELTGSRSFEFFNQNCGRKGLTVRIGRRGKHGSGRFVRVYDKGLETKECEANEWHRYEAEFSKDVADQALRWILQGQVMSEQKVEPIFSSWVGGFEPTPGWAISAAQCALGAVDFKEKKSFVSRSLRRRPRCQWWGEVIAGIEPVLIKARRVRLRCLEATQEWVRKQVAPTIMAMARVTGRSFDRVFSDLAGDLETIRSACTVAVFEYQQSAACAVPVEVHRRV